MKLDKLASSFIIMILACSVLFTSCASTTLIQSDPPGAKLFINGEHMGTTPYSYTDTKIVGSTNMVRLEKDGYEELNTSFTRDEEVDVGAAFCGFFLLVPFAWVMKYKPVHSYQLAPLSRSVEQPRMIQQPSSLPSTHPTPSSIEKPASEPKRSKADRLRELKQLLDEKIITQQEFDKEKKKILEEEEK
jgi:hypothetical protein